MVKFISVFSTRLDLPYWEGVQEADSLDELRSKGKYIAGDNHNYDKSPRDRIIGEKRIEEKNTGHLVTVSMIELDSFNIGKHRKKMIKGIFNILLFFIILLVTGCSTNGHLTRRYKSLKMIEIPSIEKFVKVDAYAIEKERESAPSKKSIFDLSPQAQKELIKQIGINETESEKIINALSKSLSALLASTIEILDYTKFEKRIVVTIKNLSHFPGDRISKINVRLKLDDKLRLLSCNRLTTEWQTLDLGKLNYSNTISGEISGNLGFGSNLVNSNTNSLGGEETSTLINGTNVSNTGSSLIKDSYGITASNSNTGTNSQGLNGKLSGSRSFAEEVMLRRRIVSLNASISENTLDLFQESISGIDLTGNILADIVFDGNSSNQDVAVEKVFSFSNLSDVNKKSNDADKIKVREFIAKYIDFREDLKATIEFDADLRHVQKGDQTISESDDIVDLYYGTFKSMPTTPKVTIIRRDQLNPKFYVLQINDNSKLPVEIVSPTGTISTLKFSSVTDAKEFNLWLKEKFSGYTDQQGNLKMNLSDGYQLKFPHGVLNANNLGVFSN